MRLLLVIATAIFSQHVSAQDGRSVVNGTIIYTGTARETNDTKALFIAEQEAIKLLLVECKLPHREMKVFKKNLGIAENIFVATVEVGITFEDCDEAKRASPELAKKISNPNVEADQEAYRLYIQQQLGISAKPFDLIAYLDTHFKGVSSRFDATNERLNDIERKLDERPGPAHTIMIQPQASAQPSQSLKPINSACQAHYNSLISQAQTAAASNFPPGNLAQGQAAILYNQAQAVMRGCQ
jgi:hypothetical protein